VPHTRTRLAAACHGGAPRRAAWRPLASLIAAVVCLLVVPEARGGHTTRGPANRRETGVERLERLRARARSSLLRRHGSKEFEAGPLMQGGAGPGAEAAEPGARTATGAAALPLSPEVQASSGVAGTQSETSIAVFGTHVVVGYNQINGNRGSGAAWSVDGGLSFVDQGGLPVGGALPLELLGDPSVTACGNGVFYYGSIFFPNATDSALSVNVGTFSGTTLSWTNPIVAAQSSADFLDKPWLTCDRLTNTLYLAYTRFVNGNVGATTELRIEIVHSTNGGTSWSAPFVLVSSTTDSVQIAYIAVGPGSEVYVAWERGIDDLTAAQVRLELRRSFDFASSFDPMLVVRTMTPSFYPAMVGFNREDTIEFGTVAADTSAAATRGNVYVVWTEREPGSVARDIFLAGSTDRAASFSAPVRVSDAPPGTDQVMPWVSVDGSGAVGAFWYDYRNWPGMHTVDVYAARSLDGGQSFGPNVRVTTAPTSWFVPASFTPNFGDYIQGASEGGGFYPSWADGRNGDIDVFVAHVPAATCGNGVLDPFEACDDGNVLDGDSCSGVCAATPCGNGVLEGFEQCDDGNTVSGDGCSETCRFEVCGDGVVQPNDKEECDDGNTTSGDGCSSTCLIEPANAAWIADERSRLVLMSLSTGRAMTLGDPGFHEMGDLAFDAAGRLFGSTGFNANLSIGLDGFLISMVALGLPGRGAAVGDTGWLAMQAIDFQPGTGTLYGIAVDSAGTSRLVTLDPATGATLAIIGDLKLNTARAMAFDAAGALYVSGGTALYTVNPATAVKTPVASLSPAVTLSGMDFAPDGTLYGVVQRGTGADGALMRIDRTTGAGTILFRSGPLNQQGIRFAPAVALDHDLDGLHDIVDCAPLDPTNAPPGPTTGLAFSDAAAGLFSWAAAPGARFSNAYRGTITGSLAARPADARFDQTCLESGDAQANGDLVSADPSLPPSGTAFYYLSDGEGCGEGPLGDADHPIPNTSPCPTPP
jgi:cysteine-rich repeat protein